jgi:hypothetical protein
MPQGFGGGVFSDFLFKPELVVFSRPIDVDQYGGGRATAPQGRLMIQVSTLQNIAHARKRPAARPIKSAPGATSITRA